MIYVEWGSLRPNNRALVPPMTKPSSIQSRGEAARFGGRLCLAGCHSCMQGHANQLANLPPATSLPWMVATKDKQCLCIQHGQRKKKWQRRGWDWCGVPCPNHQPAPKAKVTVLFLLPQVFQASPGHLPFPRASNHRSMWVLLTCIEITSHRLAGLKGHWRLSSPKSSYLPDEKQGPRKVQ